MNDRPPPFRNIYENSRYAADYAGLDWNGTYFLIQRDLPEILRQHVAGRRALDFGCGTGRSTRLLKACGFDAVGVDISASMIAAARQADPHGMYRLVSGTGLDDLDADFDLVLAAFPFDNVPAAQKPPLFQALVRRLGPEGRLVNIVSSPEIYTREWASFSTRDYPENAHARDGDVVRIVTKEFASRQPAEDVVCGAAAYAAIYEESGLEVVARYDPLGRPDDGQEWISERLTAPWVIYVLRKTRARP